MAIITAGIRPGAGFVRPDTAAPCPCVRASSRSLLRLKRFEVVTLNLDVLDHSLGGGDTEGQFLQEIAEAIAVDEVNGRRAVASSFLPGIASEGARGDKQTLITPACHSSRKSRTAEGVTLPEYLLH